MYRMAIENFELVKALNLFHPDAVCQQSPPARKGLGDLFVNTILDEDTSAVNEIIQIKK